MMQTLWLRCGILFLVLLAAACAPTHSWVSRPDVQRVESPVFVASLEAVRAGDAFFSLFRLTVANKTATPLTLDWNRTRYLYEGKNGGAFAFEGIVPEQIKSGAVPADVIAPRGRLVKMVAPVRLVAFAPVANRGAGIATEGLRAGKLPEGENGILLVLSTPAGMVRREITVRIESVTAAPPP